MRRTMAGVVAVMAAAVLIALTASAAEAMAGSAVESIARTATDTWKAGPVLNPDRAHELYVEASSLLSQPKQWRRAARLYEQSAELRDSADPELYMCLVMAGRVRATIGDTGRALEMLERAGDVALARGSVLEAAEAYIDAAHAAAGLGMAEAAYDLRDRALLLADSPLLSENQRHSITRRLKA